MSELIERLSCEFEQKDYAHAYLAEHANMALAAQIKVMREQRGLTQSKLAELADMKQERISALEDVNYDGWTLKTLRKLAKAFDVALQVRFVPFSAAIMQVANLSRKNLEVTSRAEDLSHLRNQKIVFSGDKQWRALNPSNLRVVPMRAVVTKPANTNIHWQRISVGT